MYLHTWKSAQRNPAEIQAELASVTELPVSPFMSYSALVCRDWNLENVNFYPVIAIQHICSVTHALRTDERYLLLILYLQLFDPALARGTMARAPTCFFSKDASF